MFIIISIVLLWVITKETLYLSLSLFISLSECLINLLPDVDGTADVLETDGAVVLDKKL